MTPRVLAWVPLRDERFFLERLVSSGIQLTPHLIKRGPVNGILNVVSYAILRVTPTQLEMIGEALGFYRKDRSAPCGYTSEFTGNDSDNALMDDIHRFLNPVPNR